jgi:hypothetical protein
MMVKYMEQQGWTVLEDVIMVGLDEVKNFATVKDNVTFETKPTTHNLRIFKGFLLFTIG